jgi:SAM-dependent methyltransferase
MSTARCNEIQVENILKQVLDISCRISMHSPPIKPFIRFSKEFEYLFKRERGDDRRLFWDFDHTLQEILLSIARSIATPDQLLWLNYEQWNKNLADLQSNKRNELQKMIKDRSLLQFKYTPRDEFILGQINPKSHFLYVGCGSGTECLRFAKLGHSVIGIDNIPELVDIANSRAEFLSLPFKAICMDAMSCDFAEESFDSFLLEFYGWQPSSTQTLLLQENLASILKKEGKGFIVAPRRKYCSYWFRMGSFYSEPMTSWLMEQASIDYLFSQADESEERLAYGLFWRSYTANTLAAELRQHFNIIKCGYEKYDPRYVIAMVERKAESSHERLLGEDANLNEPKVYRLDTNEIDVESILQRLTAICDILEVHERNTIQFFERNSNINAIRGVRTDLSKFIELLEDIFSVLPLSCSGY